ncbi:uncharacterized protein PG986_000659 [Apiospora aurea]|uniref:Uncharacterized protein n=1 Tax=Apiospora aurea TaxID=335848 RepID=A0ABR1QUL9_9PEZI
MGGHTDHGLGEVEQRNLGGPVVAYGVHGGYAGDAVVHAQHVLPCAREQVGARTLAMTGKSTRRYGRKSSKDNP